jgi:hypothetical protein
VLTVPFYIFLEWHTTGCTLWKFFFLYCFSLHYCMALPVGRVNSVECQCIMNWKGFGRKRSTRGKSTAICLGRLRIITEHLSQDSRCPTRDSNRAPPEYKSRAFTAMPTRSISILFHINLNIPSTPMSPHVVPSRCNPTLLRHYSTNRDRSSSQRVITAVKCEARIRRCEVFLLNAVMSSVAE